MDSYEHRLQHLLGEDNVWQQNLALPSAPKMDSLADPMAAMSLHEMRKHATRKYPHASSGAKSGGASNTKPKPVKKVKFDAVGLHRGEQVNRDTAFCPWKLVKGYPHQFIGKQNKPKALPFFTANALHKNQPWDLYYVHIPHSTSAPTPLILVPTYQFQHHLDNINAVLGINLAIPGDKNGEKFCVSFGAFGTPLPRYLGRSSTAGGLDTLKKRVPPFNSSDDIKDLPPQIREDYINFLARLRNCAKEGKKKKSAKHKDQRRKEHMAWGRSLKRVQRYLGLREKVLSDPQDISSTLPVGSEVPIGDPEGSVIFVSIDIEAYEFDQDMITEVGLAIFDTLDIQNRQPGVNGNEWFPLVQGFHIRVKENSGVHNHVHVKGCADRFDFGNSAFINKNDVGRATLDLIERAAMVDSVEPRPVVLVFHDRASDIAYLEKLGVKTEDFKGVREVVDSRDIYQHRVKALNPTKLGSVLGALGIPYRHLHNAGNDAVYTLQALIAMAVLERKKSRDRAASGVQRPPINPEDDQGWETGGEGSDGGNICETLPAVNEDVKIPNMSWNSTPESSPTKKIAPASAAAQSVEWETKEPNGHYHCVMDLDDTDDEGEGKAW